MSSSPVSPPREPVRSSSAEQALLELPLEGVLEEASARRVLNALASKFGVDASEAGAEDLTHFAAMVAFVEQRLEERAPAAPAADVATAKSSAALNVRRLVLDETIARTGYPEEMLEPELDLEAELGIDTVKQVDIFAAVRTKLGLTRDPSFVLRDFNTLAKVIAHFEERAGKGTTSAATKPEAKPLPVAKSVPAKPAPTPPPREREPTAPVVNASSLSRADVQALLIKLLAEKTGYPVEMLELDLDLEAELGIDTVKQVDVFAKAREQLGLVRDPNVTLRDLNTLRKVVDHLFERAHAAPIRAETSVRPERSRGAASTKVTEALLSLDLETEAKLTATERTRLAKAVGAPNEDARTLGEMLKKRGRTGGRG